MTPSGDAPAVAPDPAGICRRLRETPAMQALLATQPSFRTPPMVFAPLALGGGLAATFAVVLVGQLDEGSRGRNGLRWDFAGDRGVIIGWCVAIAVALLVAVLGLRGLRRFGRVPATAVPAVALAKRTETWHRTTFFMTYWCEGRGQSEEIVDVATFGDVLPGDVGAAWFRGGRFVGFRKLSV